MITMFCRLAAVLAATGLTCTLVLADSPRRMATVEVGEKVPDFSVSDVKGKIVKLSDLRKSTPTGIVSLTFWCSFCHSCRKMEAQLDRAAKELKGKAAVVAVDASAGETAETVSAFARRKGLTFPILLDEKGHSADLFGVRVTTTTLVIDREGILRYRGQFARGTKLYAEDALRALLSGGLVPKSETADHG